MSLVRSHNLQHSKVLNCISFLNYSNHKDKRESLGYWSDVSNTLASQINVSLASPFSPFFYSSTIPYVSSVFKEVHSSAVSFQCQKPWSGKESTCNGNVCNFVRKATGGWNPRVCFGTLTPLGTFHGIYLHPNQPSNSTQKINPVVQAVSSLTGLNRPPLHAW